MILYTIVRAAVAVYRANPFRPHCSSAQGRHVWLCRVLNGASVGCEPGASVGGEGYHGWNGRGGRNPFAC